MTKKNKKVAISVAIAVTILGLFSLAFRDPEMNRDDRVFIVHTK